MLLAVVRREGDSLSRLAVWSIGTESGEVRLTQCPPHMPTRALGPKTAEATVIVWTLDPAMIWLGVEIQTLSTELALAELDKPDTFRHGTQIPVVRVLAIVTDFAEVAKVVLANRCLLLAFAWVGGERGYRLEVYRCRGGVAQGTDGGS